MSAFHKPTTLEEQLDSIHQATPITAIARIKIIAANKDGYGPDQVLLILESALTREVRTTPQRRGVIQALKQAIKRSTPRQTLSIITNRQTSMIQTTTIAASEPEVTTEQPKDPRWDFAREISDNIRLHGRMFLRGQVKLGWILTFLKKECGHVGSGRRNKVPESGTFLTWAELVKQETGYSRQSCDEFIRYYEASQVKIKTSKKLDLPAAARQDAIVLFQTENPLTLTDAQWRQVDDIIGSLTTGETQASLMQELGIISTPKAMPKGGKTAGAEDNALTAGQLAFHFFEAIAAPMINARTNPDYKKLLYALPLTSTQEHPLSLATLESEARAMLADIEDAKQATAKPAKGRVINA